MPMSPDRFGTLGKARYLRPSFCLETLDRRQLVAPPALIPHTFPSDGAQDIKAIITLKSTSTSTCSMQSYAAFVFRAGTGGPKSHSPSAQIPADQTSSSELMQKKLIVWPISSHEPAQRFVRPVLWQTHAPHIPVSVTLKKNVSVMTEWGVCQQEQAEGRRTCTVCERERDEE